MRVISQLSTSLDIAKIRADFPILARQVHPGVPLIYLDSTATAQKPLQVIQAMDDYYRHSNANIHRGIHVLAERPASTGCSPADRILLGPSARQVIFTRNATESINLVAYSWGRANLQAGELIILTEMEHHSNLVPWHMLAANALRLNLSRLPQMACWPGGLPEPSDLEAA
jgi:cysteine desulfurase/selenocysteine lyase